MDTPSTRPKSSLPLSFTASDRRTQARLSAEVLGLDPEARLSLGLHVRLLNVSNGGALLELHEWVRPGTRSELRLFTATETTEPEKLVAPGQVARCWVHRLSPLRYRAALVFTAPAPPSAVPAPAEPGEVTVNVERSA